LSRLLRHRRQFEANRRGYGGQCRQQLVDHFVGCHWGRRGQHVEQLGGIEHVIHRFERRYRIDERRRRQLGGRR
jgi:hypothetical protein